MPPLTRVIKSAPENARLTVVGSSEFINDTVLGLSRSMGQDRYLNNIQFAQNIIDWSVADQELLGIRSRGAHTRILTDMSPSREKMWEWLNYGIALLALTVISVIAKRKKKNEKPMKLVRSQDWNRMQEG